jgi:hypothetical protein
MSLHDLSGKAVRQEQTMPDLPIEFYSHPITATFTMAFYP